MAEICEAVPETLCICGHPNEEHAVDGRCLHGLFTMDEDWCNCWGFRKAMDDENSKGNLDTVPKS